MEIREELQKITTAYMIGLGYTVPPYNGKHSKEYFDQLMALIDQEKKRYALEVIGEDEVNKESHPEHNPSYFWSVQGGNYLRAEQRKKVEGK